MTPLETRTPIPIPHTSPGLNHLRKGVTCSAWVVGLSLAVQIVTWALAAFTDLRYTTLEGSSNHEAVPVVVSGLREREEVEEVDSSASTSVSVHSLSASEREALSSGDHADAAPPPNVNRVRSRCDVWFGLQHQLALICGVAAAFVLAVQTLVGTAVGSGAAIYGLRQVISAQNWALALLALVVPWQRAFADMPFTGVFTGYETMTTEVDAYLADASTSLSGMIFYGRYLILPGAALAATILIGWRFSAGAETGIVLGGMTPEELEIEAEASNRAAGSLFNAGRVGGALQSTLGLAAASTAVAPLATTGLAPTVDGADLSAEPATVGLSTRLPAQTPLRRPI